MKKITEIKKELIKLLKENKWQEVAIDDIGINSQRVYYKIKTPFGNFLCVTYDKDLNFMFGHSSLSEANASMAIGGTTIDDYVADDFYCLCKDIILGVKTIDDVRLMQSDYE